MLRKWGVWADWLMAHLRMYMCTSNIREGPSGFELFLKWHVKLGPHKTAQKKMENLHQESLQKCTVIQESCVEIVPMFYSASLIKNDNDN